MSILLGAANGFLLDQFLEDTTNHRTDEYGGPIENRARLLLEVVDAVVGVWGAGRVGVHLSPRGPAHDISDRDPPATFGYVARELGRRNLAFICVREPLGPDWLVPALKRQFGGVVIANDGFALRSAELALAAGDADAVAFGRLFISNPDLPRRLATRAPLAKWDQARFYEGGSLGYTDYPALSGR